MSISGDILTEFDDGACQFLVNFELYGIVAIFKTCYAFMGYCYVYLDYVDDKYIKVIIKKKDGKDVPPNFAEEFLNELVNQRLRVDINKETGRIREMLVAKALLGVGLKARLPADIETAQPLTDDYIADELNISDLKGI